MIGHLRLLCPVSPHDEHVHVDHNACGSGRVVDDDDDDKSAGFSRWRAALCPVSPHTLHRYALSTRRSRRADDFEDFDVFEVFEANFEAFEVFGVPAASGAALSPYFSS